MSRLDHLASEIAALSGSADLASPPALLLTIPTEVHTSLFSTRVGGTNQTDFCSLVGVGVVVALLLATWTTNWSEALARFQIPGSG